MEEKRIYAIVAATIQVPLFPNTDRIGTRTVVQPAGRQVAQACHAVSLLRHRMLSLDTDPKDLSTDELISVARQMDKFIPLTTIILQARDSNELAHVLGLLNRKYLRPVVFADDNPEYGPSSYSTAVAVLATSAQVFGVLDYLPLWPTEHYEKVSRLQ